jgi:para-aminobenzoate synthetase/4-amino-4-deoxychorismate lyase
MPGWTSWSRKMRPGVSADRAATAVRFDSLAGGGASYVFRQPSAQVAAWHADDVVPALHAVGSAVAAGEHAAGFIAYEAAPALDPALVTHLPRPDLPLVWFGLFAEREEIEPLADLDGSAATDPPPVGCWMPTVAADEYARRVERIRDRIAAGETYQVNLTFQLAASYAGEHGPLYAALCRSQRAAYCAWLRGPFGSILSASPELFFRWAGDQLEMRPMKGTRPRGRWTDEDDALSRELLGSAKERAENLMIVDLLRNDAGRVAEFGSVQVPRMFDAERYPTVHQLTSTVTARTRRDVTLIDVLRALFPSGSVTGAPKVSTMRIIREMEDGPRGVYTGAIGFVSPGEAVFNVPIRTLITVRPGLVEMGVGSGITFDSDPGAEHRGCMQKASFVRERVPAMELLETMLYEPGDGFRHLDAHLRRLARSARYFDYPFEVASATGALDAAVERARPESPDVGAPLRVRLLVNARGDVRVEIDPLPPLPPRLRARIATEPIDSRNAYLYHKTTARHVYDSRLAAHPGYDEVLLTNERGELTEFTTGNLVIVLDGRACTPPIGSGLLPGIEREAMLAEGELDERVLRLEDLARAEAVYLINSVRHRVPVDLEL